MGVKISEMTSTSLTVTQAGIDALEFEINNSGVTEKITRKKIRGGYKSYVAIIEQSGTNAPVANVLENTLGGTPIWSYSSQGNYDCTLSGAFTQNKIIFFTSQYPDVKINVQQISANVIRVVSSDTSGGSEFPFDGLMDNISLEIRVYE